jgi:hypothetical protein
LLRTALATGALAAGALAVHAPAALAQAAGGETIYVHHWYAKEPNSDIILTEVVFHTIVAFDPRLANRKGPMTFIEVVRKTFSKSAPNIAPGEKELGAPVYPGALYDSHDSKLMLGGLEAHAFLSADPVEQVVAFYERALGLPAMKGAPLAGGVNWYFRPFSANASDDYMSIESAEGAPAPYKTRVIFNLMRIPPEKPAGI